MYMRGTVTVISASGMKIQALFCESDHLAQLDNKDQKLMWSVEARGGVSEVWSAFKVLLKGLFPQSLSCLDRMWLFSSWSMNL